MKNKKSFFSSKYEDPILKLLRSCKVKLAQLRCPVVDIGSASWCEYAYLMSRLERHGKPDSNYRLSTTTRILSIIDNYLDVRLSRPRFSKWTLRYTIVRIHVEEQRERVLCALDNLITANDFENSFKSPSPVETYLLSEAEGCALFWMRSLFNSLTHLTAAIYVSGAYTQAWSKARLPDLAFIRRQQWSRNRFESLIHNLGAAFELLRQAEGGLPGSAKGPLWNPNQDPLNRERLGSSFN